MATLTTTFTTFANLARSGSVDSWTNAANAQTSNDVRAGMASAVAGSGYTDYLKCTGLTDKLPAGAVVSGITITIERRDASGTTYDSVVELVVGSAIQTTQNKAATSTAWPTADGSANYGGSSDLWGLTPTLTQFNASDFGVVISATVANGSVGTGF